MRSILFLLLPIILFSGCIPSPEYPIEPEIGFVSISKTLLERQQDTMQVVFSFKDGDGDLGFQSYDPEDCDKCNLDCLEHSTLSIFVFDSRTGCLTPFNVPYVPPQRHIDDISGEVKMVLSTCCIIGGFACAQADATDTVVYTIQLKDRAGHLSNKIELPPVVIRCNQL